MTEVMNKEISSYKDLRVWQDGIQLAKEIYHLCSRLPKEELYGLASQMKRAAISIPSNIAEGHSRNHRSEYRQYVYIALGSLAELETQVQIAKELGLISETSVLVERLNHLRVMLITLGRKL